MESKDFVDCWAEDVSDPRYRYELTAWVYLGPADEIPSRTKAADSIFQNPRHVKLRELGLTSSPSLPGCTVSFDIYDNAIQSLPPVLHLPLKAIDASHNKLTDLPELPDLESLDVIGSDFPQPPQSLYSLPSSTELRMEWISAEFDRVITADVIYAPG